MKLLGKYDIFNTERDKMAKVGKICNKTNTHQTVQNHIKYYRILKFVTVWYAV